MACIDERIAQATRRIIELLVRCDYDAIEKYSGGVRLKAVDLAKAVHDYGQKLVRPPLSDLENLDIIEVESADPKRWSVRFDLWTVEEGRSDLSIELTLIDNGSDELTVEVDNLHVL